MLRDGRAEAAGRTRGDRRDAVHQRARRDPGLHDLLFDTALAGVIVAVWSLVASGDQPVAWTIAGAVVYLVGIPGITMVCNVPLNNRLERLDPADPAATGAWDEYVVKWTAYNHARVIAGLAAAALFTIALTQ